MRIEKPKPPIPREWIVLACGMGLLILALPFFAKTSPSQPSSKEKSNSETAVAESQQAANSETTDAIPTVYPPGTEEGLPVAVPLPETQKQEPAQEKQLSPKTPLAGLEPSAILTSFHGDVKVIGPSGEQKAEKNRHILEGETIEVGAAGEAVLEIQELYVLRLKPNTKLAQLEPAKDKIASNKERVTYRFRLEQGALLGTTKFRGDKLDMLDLLIKDKIFNVQDSTFRAQLSDAAEPWMGVLRGSVKSGTENIPSAKPVVIRALEKVPLTGESADAPVKVTQQEWGLLRETYDMNVKTAVQEAQQVDLSKRAGDFFGYVFDHGTFYTENLGYTVRDFYEDKISGDVYLEAEYDVFPANSFVGLYVLTRDLDARDFAGLRFDVRQKPDESCPDRFYVEIKSKGQFIHRFEIAGIKPYWETRQIDFFSPISIPITEVTLVFLNESIGANKKGYIQMRNVQMIPLSDEQKAKRAEAEKKTVALSGTQALPQAPRSMNQAMVTTSVKKAIKIENEEAVPVPYRVDDSKKIAKEVPKVVSLDDLS